MQRTENFVKCENEIKEMMTEAGCSGIIFLNINKDYSWVEFTIRDSNNLGLYQDFSIEIKLPKSDDFKCFRKEVYCIISEEALGMFKLINTDNPEIKSFNERVQKVLENVYDYFFYEVTLK